MGKLVSKPLLKIGEVKWVNIKDLKDVNLVDNENFILRKTIWILLWPVVVFKFREGWPIFFIHLTKIYKEKKRGRPDPKNFPSPSSGGKEYPETTVKDRTYFCLFLFGGRRDNSHREGCPPTGHVLRKGMYPRTETWGLHRPWVSRRFTGHRSHWHLDS